MNRSSLFLRLLFKAAWVRKDRAFTALTSVAVVATIATAALTIYSDLEGKLSREFRGFGANVIVTKMQGSLSADELQRMNATLSGNNADKSMVVPVAYAITTATDESRVVVGGADLQALRELNTWWSTRPVDGSSGKALIGSRAARLLSPTNGKFTMAFAGRAVGIQPGLGFLFGLDDG